MTYDEFLDNEKKRGRIVWACLNCAFRGIGAAVFYHDMNNPEHRTVTENELDKKIFNRFNSKSI